MAQAADPDFIAVIVISVLVTLVPVADHWLNSLTSAEATEAPVAVPPVQISASTAVWSIRKP